MALPQALELLERCWDPFDAHQSQAVAAVLVDLLVYVPSDDPRAAELISIAKRTLEDAVSGARLSPWPPAVLAAAPMAEGVQFLQFLRTLRLLRSVGSFEGLLSQQLLQRLALRQLLQGQLVPYMRSLLGVSTAGSVAALEAVSFCIPREWLQHSVPQELTSFVELCKSAAELLETRRQQEGGGRGPPSPPLLALAKRLRSVLTSVGQASTAQRLSAAFAL